LRTGGSWAMRSASRNRRSNSWCSRAHTPASCQSRNRRQHATPEQPPISRGSISHGMPDRNTTRCPSAPPVTTPEDARPWASAVQAAIMVQQSTIASQGAEVRPSLPMNQSIRAGQEVLKGALSAFNNQCSRTASFGQTAIRKRHLAE
jgi:hypothetical protein